MSLWFSALTEGKYADRCNNASTVSCLFTNSTLNFSSYLQPKAKQGSTFKVFHKTDDENTRCNHHICSARASVTIFQFCIVLIQVGILVTGCSTFRSLQVGKVLQKLNNSMLGKGTSHKTHMPDHADIDSMQSTSSIIFCDYTHSIGIPPTLHLAPDMNRRCLPQPCSGFI